MAGRTIDVVIQGTVDGIKRLLSRNAPPPRYAKRRVAPVQDKQRKPTENKGVK